MKRKGNSRTEAGLLRVSGVLLLLLVILAALAVVSVAIGSAGYSVPEILKAVVSPEQSPVKTIVLRNAFLFHYVPEIVVGNHFKSAPLFYLT